MICDFLNSMYCIRQDKVSDYHDILNSWRKKNFHVALMPAIWWYGGTYNLFDQKAGVDGDNMIWLIPAGQSNYFWLNDLKKKIVDFYETGEMDISDHPCFPGIEAENFEECILLHTDTLQSDPEYTILGANVVLVRLSLSSGRDTLLFILLDHQNCCWEKIIEDYRISLTWFVDSGRGTGDYYVYTNLYQRMKNTPYPEILPPLYFKGLYNKGEIPEGFRFLYAMLSQPDADGYDKWHTFSAVFDTGWRN
jgi:hypothetical protein